MEYRLYDIAKRCEGKLIGDNELITNLIFDSRTPFSDEGNLFAAIRTAKNDGHNYINSAFEKGCRSFLVSDVPNELIGKASFIIVNDTLKALQTLAQSIRNDLKFTIVGITGSNGKTTVKEWLYQILNPSLTVYKSPKSFNSQLGVALSLIQSNPIADIGIIEAGISKPGEIDNLEQMIKPDIGIITNIGDAHQANFLDKKEKLNEKLRLFSNATGLIYCADHELVSEEIEKGYSHLKKLSWGYHPSAQVKIENTESGFYCIYKGIKYHFVLADKDQYHFENIMHCIALCFHLKVPIDVIQKGIEGIKPIPMRLEMKQGQQGTLLVNDSYSADFKSLEVALDYLFKVAGTQKKTLIVTEFDDQNISAKTYEAKFDDYIKKYKLSRVVLIGEKLEHIKLSVASFQYYTTTTEFIQHNSEAGFAKEAILIKGARRFKLEQLINLFQAKSHRTRLEISLSALRSNFNYVKTLLKPKTGIMVMLKALGYGAGTFELARLLQNVNANYIAVAYIDEGVALRQKGIDLPIMVLNPEGEGFANLVKYRLEPEVYSIEILQELVQFLSENNPIHRIKIHLNIDTGMHRLGFKDEIEAALKFLLENHNLLKVESVFTHLAASDKPEFDAFTSLQIERFKIATGRVSANLGDDFFTHAANTSGLIRHKNALFDMVRLGIGFYGVDPSGNSRGQLELAFRWQTQISQIKHIKAGESVGYSRSWIASKDTTIATIPVGYADGLSRRLSNENGWVYINGQKAPIIGSVCMDMCMLNISKIKCKTGDSVVIFENETQLMELCKAQETIPYELLAQISTRVKRVYLEE